MVRNRLEVALKQIEFARNYTLTLIEDIDDAEWFSMPAGCVTHVGWQIGHLAVAQYGLCLFRIRGRQPNDTDLMSSTFRKQFSRGTTPQKDAGRKQSASEIRQVFHRVYHQSLQELGELADADLTDPIDEPYAVEATKMGGLYFCASHEMLHAGQIGLLRRLLGQQPVR